jgi:hypothetical protein
MFNLVNFKKRGALTLFLMLCLVQMAVPGFHSSGMTSGAAMASSLNVSISNTSESPATLTRLSTATFTATVSAAASLSNTIVDFEVFDAGNNRIYQTYQSGVTLTANTPRTLTAAWTVPANQAAGAYQVRVGLFDAWWNARYAWTDAGAAFTVASISTLGALTAVAGTGTLGRGENFSVAVDVPSNLSNGIVDFEVFDTANNRIYQTYQSGVTLTANVPRTFTAAWPIPASQALGTYQVRVGLFDAWWNTRYAWTDTGTPFTIAPASNGIGVTVSSGSVAPWNSESFTATVDAASNLTNAIVDFEIFDAGNNRIYQSYQSGVTLTANVPQTFTAAWPVPASQAPGAYQVRVGLFDAWWSDRYAWSDPGSAFTVVPANSSPPPAPVAGSIALGAWLPGDEWDPSVVDTYTAMVGTAPRIVMWYQDWVTDSGFHTAIMNTYTARGEMPLITWLPNDAGSPPQFDRAVANGKYDPFLDQWARSAAAWGKPFYLRFATEMNGFAQPFAAGINGNTAADYVAMWQHVHDLFVRDGATNVRWVWCPNIAFGGSTPFASLYPGDAYVDWIALDGYNWGPSDQWHSWTSLYDIFSASYAQLTAMSTKPMMIGEISSTEQGGNKGAWITQGLLNDLPAHFPRIHAVVWFNEAKEWDWRANSSPQALAAFQQVAASPVYQGRLQ